MKVFLKFIKGENLLILCLDLFLAGSKTTSDTLAWMISYLVMNPQWKKELQQELDKVIGRDRSPTVADINNLPFIEAFIAEVSKLIIAYFTINANLSRIMTSLFMNFLLKYVSKNYF
jgi:hypothetical protein